MKDTRTIVQLFHFLLSGVMHVWREPKVSCCLKKCCDDLRGCHD